jgi:ligand-binding sensor domain-containing protein/DNA-binding CsgD family transcriptional regulator
MLRLINSLFLFFLSASTFVQAQEFSTFSYFPIDEVPSRELIKNISKDRQGFVWLATDQGVVRFDGRESLHFFKEFPAGYTKGFLLRSNGQHLVLFDAGLREIINNRDTVIFRQPEIQGRVFIEALNYPKSIYEDRTGNIWIGEFDAIVRIDNEGRLHRYELESNFESISYHRSFCFREDAFGNVWIVSFNGQLLTYFAREDRLLEVELKQQLTEVSFLLNVKGDHLLMGGKEGLIKLKIDSDREIVSQDFLNGVTGLSSAYALDENRIYLGTWQQGLYVFDFDSKNPLFQPEKKIDFQDILAFHYDPVAHELWVAGSENLGVFKPSIIKPLNPTENQRIESIGLHEDGSIYYSVGQHIYKLYQNSDSSAVVSSSINTYFDRILIHEGKIWVGDAFGSIFYLDMRSMEKVEIQEKSLNSTSHIFLDSNGNLWFSGYNSWLSRITPDGKLHKYQEVKRSRVVKESKDGILICAATGVNVLYRFNAEQDRFEEIPFQKNDLPDNFLIEDLAFDSTGRLLMASDAGLLETEINNETLELKKVHIDGLPVGETFRAIAVDGEEIWLATPLGLVLVRKGMAVTFTVDNGLPSKILKDRGLLLDTQGNLLIATAKGMAKINTKSENFLPTPKPVFKSIRNKGKQILLEQSTEFDFPYNSRISAEFISLNYPGNAVQYQTRIKGLEDDWSLPGLNNNISILGFQSGNYELEVRARDGGHLWSEPTVFSFTILNPWYQTWWAALAFIIIAVLLTTAIVKWHNYNLIRQKKKLQKIIEVRTAEINQQKNEIIEQKNRLIAQKEELLSKTKAVYESQQALVEADLKFLHLKEKQLEDQIEFKNKQITTHTLNIIQKNETLKDLRGKLEEISHSPNGSAQQELRKTLKMIDSSFRLDKDWEEFKLYFEQIYTGFYSKLKINYPELSNQELRHCALIRLNLSTVEIASILGISPDSIKVSRNRIRKKLKLPSNQNLSDFILTI